MRKIGYVLAAAAVAAAVYGLFLRPKPLRMGTRADFRPFAFRTEDGEIAGLDVDVAREIARKMGRSLRVVELEFGELLPALADGRVDLALAALAPDEESRRAADFSAPYYRATPVVLIRRGDPVPASIEDLRNRTIGVQAGSTGAGAAAELTDAENIRTAQSALGSVADLLNSQVDFAIVDEEPAERFEQTNPEMQLVRLGFGEESYAVAVRQGHAELKTAVDRVLAEMKADGRFGERVDRWMVRLPWTEAEGQ